MAPAARAAPGGGGGADRGPTNRNHRVTIETDAPAILARVREDGADVVEHAAAPHFLFSDFPLGNSAGQPRDLESQHWTLALAVTLLEAAPGPRTTIQSPLRR